MICVGLGEKSSPTGGSSCAASSGGTCTVCAKVQPDRHLDQGQGHPLASTTLCTASMLRLTVVADIHLILQDKQASDSMAAAIELARLNRLVRAAVTMIKGIQIAQTERGFEMAVFSVVPWFKVRQTPCLCSHT